MRYAVLRPFNTPSRRLAVGMVLFAEEIDGPVSPADLRAGGFIQEDDPAAPVQPPKVRRGSIPQPPLVEKDIDDGVV